MVTPATRLACTYIPIAIIPIVYVDPLGFAPSAATQAYNKKAEELARQRAAAAKAALEKARKAAEAAIKAAAKAAAEKAAKAKAAANGRSLANQAVADKAAEMGRKKAQKKKAAENGRSLANQAVADKVAELAAEKAKTIKPSNKVSSNANDNPNTGMLPYGAPIRPPSYETIEKAIDFFDPNTQTWEGSFQKGRLKGSGRATLGYSEVQERLQHSKADSGDGGWLGFFGKLSIFNASGKIGTTIDTLVGDVSISQKGVLDVLTATAQVGAAWIDKDKDINDPISKDTKEGIGIGAAIKASALTARRTTECEVFGWQIESGVTGELFSVGAHFSAGIYDGEYGLDYGVAPGLYGWGYSFRVKPPQYVLNFIKEKLT